MLKSNELLRFIMGYKRSSALIAAYCSGLVSLLHDNCLDIQTLAIKAEMNQEQLYVFLLYLKNINFVEEKDEKWCLSEEFADSYKQLQNFENVICHEKSIFSKWMNPEQIEKSLKVKAGDREFDYIGFSEEEQKRYDNTMYGNNLRLIGLKICREIRGIKMPSVLEYGRSQDYLLRSLRKAGCQFNGSYMVDETVCTRAGINQNAEFIKLEETGCTQKFDFIMLYNTIHYYPKDILLNKISLMERFLKKNGFIIVVDLFYKKEDSFSSDILLDWLTHGGTAFLTVESFLDELENSDYHLSRSVEMPQISTTMLIIQKNGREG